MLSDAPNATKRQNIALQNLHARYTGFRDTTNIALLYVETQLMKSYLKKPNEETLKNFVAVESVRRASETEQMLAYEYSNLASFAIYPYARMSGQAYNFLDYEIWLSALNEDNVSNYYLDLKHYVKNTLDYISMAGTVALENIDTSWKVKANAQLISTQEMLMEHYVMSSDEITKRATTAKLNYGFDRVKKKLDEKWGPELSQLDVELKSYRDMAGVVIYVISSASDYGFFYYNRYAVDSETELHVYPQGTGKNSTDFSFKNLKYLMLRSDIENNKKISEFKLPSDASITIDGVKSTVANMLAAKQKTPFKLIEVSKPSGSGYNFDMAVTVVSENGGILDASNGSTIEITR